jgi:hypothetical protein
MKTTMVYASEKVVPVIKMLRVANQPGSGVKAMVMGGGGRVRGTEISSALRDLADNIDAGVEDDDTFLHAKKVVVFIEDK